MESTLHDKPPARLLQVPELHAGDWRVLAHLLLAILLSQVQLEPAVEIGVVEIRGVPSERNVHVPANNRLSTYCADSDRFKVTVCKCAARKTRQQYAVEDFGWLAILLPQHEKLQSTPPRMYRIPMHAHHRMRFERGTTNTSMVQLSVRRCDRLEDVVPLLQ